MKCKLQRKVCVGHASVFNCYASSPTCLCLLRLTRLRGFSFLDFCLFVTRRKKEAAKHPRSKLLAVTVTRRLPFSNYLCLPLTFSIFVSLLPYLTSFLFVFCLANFFACTPRYLAKFCRRRRLLAILIVSSFFEFEVSLSLSLSLSPFPFYSQFCSAICFRTRQEVYNTFSNCALAIFTSFSLSGIFCHKSSQLFLIRSQEI